jgi:hypothetical protein
MSSESNPKLPQLPWSHRAAVATPERVVRRIGARIFRELLTPNIRRRALSHSSRLLQPSLGDLQEQPPDGALVPRDTSIHNPVQHATQAKKETPAMRVYRTEAPYYFSSKQLLPVGALVYFSDKRGRYIHPTAGILLDPHPRLQLLSGEESQAFAEHWREQL